MVRQRASGCLFGMAFGDALGAATEFLTIPDIQRRFPPNGPRELEGNPALVTDDTQMALAVGRALLHSTLPYTVNTLFWTLTEEFIAWVNSPENNRAPGNTCLTACYALAEAVPWLEATVTGSKGCGANMRVAPVGLLPDVADTTRAAIAQFQAALTHGHPTALAASDLTAFAIADLVADGHLAQLPDHLREYANSQRQVWHADWLSTLWQRPYISSPEEFIAKGWDECVAALDKLDAALVKQDRTTDPCLQTGAGWIAEEAMATGLLCFLLFPNDPVAAIQRAALTSGDSDSIASLTGAFTGAHLGLAAWPRDWVSRIEYRDELSEVGQAWDR